ncbi:hypothetical protein K438DRAFT_448811 [Mycena galopus ATCC 62051]|nr:hypothetical protein K438DRAFT_448811 [Mycena galopus ATCC 62051]
MLDLSTCCSNCSLQKLDSNNVSLPPLPHHLMTTNEPPSKGEAAEVRDIIGAVQSHVAELDASIATLETALAKLRLTRKEADRHIHGGRSILSNLRRVPSDVLAEIFLKITPDASHRRLPLIDSHPWTLARVSRAWRVTALSLPSLWSNIDSSRPLPMLEEQLRRSNAFGLTITLRNSDVEALNVLMGCSQRWETVDFQETGDFALESNLVQTLDLARGQFPMLRALKYAEYTGGSCRAFENAPKLSAATILHGAGSWLLPWAQITRLRHAFFSPEELQSACNLVQLTLTGAAREGLPHWTPATELPRLRTLYVTDGECLRFLAVPALEDICIARNPSFIVPLIARSSCHLQKITLLQDAAFGQSDVPIVLSDTLLEMRLAKPFVQILSHLTIPSDLSTECSPTCPALRALHFTEVAEDYNCSRVVALMESRLANPDCLTPSLCVLNCKRIRLDPSPQTALKGLRQQGIDVEWLYGKAAKQRLIGWEEHYF